MPPPCAYPVSCSSERTIRKDPKIHRPSRACEPELHYDCCNRTSSARQPCSPARRPSCRLLCAAPFEYAAVAPPGARLVFAAGACPLNDAGEVVGPGDYELQMQTAFE